MNNYKKNTDLFNKLAEDEQKVTGYEHTVDQSSTEKSATTSGGVSFTYKAELTSAKLKVLGTIIDYGSENNFSDAFIKIAASIAYHESWLGGTDAYSTAVGLFGYRSVIWSARDHSSLDIDSDTDQLKAMFEDITYFNTEYASASSSTSLINYVAVMHHFGEGTEIGSKTYAVNRFLLAFDDNIEILDLGL